MGLPLATKTQLRDSRHRSPNHRKQHKILVNSKHAKSKPLPLQVFLATSEVGEVWISSNSTETSSKNHFSSWQGAIAAKLVPCPSMKIGVLILHLNSTKPKN